MKFKFWAIILGAIGGLYASIRFIIRNWVGNRITGKSTGSGRIGYDLDVSRERLNENRERVGDIRDSNRRIESGNREIRSGTDDLREATERLREVIRKLRAKD